MLRKNSAEGKNSIKKVTNYTTQWKVHNIYTKQLASIITSDRSETVRFDCIS